MSISIVSPGRIPSFFTTSAGITSPIELPHLFAFVSTLEVMFGEILNLVGGCAKRISNRHRGSDCRGTGARFRCRGCQGSRARLRGRNLVIIGNGRGTFIRDKLQSPPADVRERLGSPRTGTCAWEERRAGAGPLGADPPHGLSGPRRRPAGWPCDHPPRPRGP